MKKIICHVVQFGVYAESTSYFCRKEDFKQRPMCKQPNHEYVHDYLAKKKNFVDQADLFSTFSDAEKRL